MGFERNNVDGRDISPSKVTADDLGLSGSRENPFASNQDDLSDVTVHYQQKTPSSVTEFTLVDVSNGPKTVIGGGAFGWNFRTTSGGGQRVGPVTIDGTANSDYPSSDAWFWEVAGGTFSAGVPFYPIVYDSSFKLEWEQSGTGIRVVVGAYVLGSGPHSAAIVTDGEPVYSVHRNLSDADIEALNAPDGYRVVKNPDLSHRDPQVKGAWNDSKGVVEDHPYWAPFHDALENAKRAASQYGPREFLANVDTPADRGNIPFSTPAPGDGTTPPDPSNSTDPENDAVAFLKERWDAELPDSI